MQYILEDGIPVECQDYLSWVAWRSRHDPVIKQDSFEFEVSVSTIFIGIGFPKRLSNPMVFETMVFWGEDADQFRYETLEGAKAGHASLEKKIRDLFELPLEKMALLLNEKDPLTSYIVRKRLGGR